MHGFRLLSAVVLSALLLSGAACTGDDAEPPASPTSDVSTPSTLTPIESLQEADFGAPELVGPLIDAAGGGEVTAERVHFADLVGEDGVDEAFVIVESGGTLGDVGVGIYVLEDGQAVLQQFIQTAGRVEFRLDLVVTLEGIWAAEDAQCCPSELLERSYQWDGQEFAVITEQVVPNPSQ